jgi:hypothetical protein
MAHLTNEDLESIFSQSRKPKVYTRVVRHLLSGCESCKRLAAETLQRLGLDVGLLAEATEAEALAEPLPEALRVSALIEEERKRAKISFARLAPLSAPARLSSLRKQGRYKKYGLALFVLDEAESLTLRRSYAKAKELVHFSMAIADVLRPGIYGPGALGDLRLRQYTTLANLRRLEDDFVGALESLSEADDLRHLGVDPLEEVRFFRVQATLLFDLGEFERAAEASEERAALCELVGDTDARAKALLQKARILAQYEPEAGLITADDGLALLDPADSYPLVCGIFNRAFCLIQLHRADDAADYLLSHKVIIRKVVDSHREIYFLWLDAKIMRDQKRYRDAEELFSYVALRFSEEKMNQEMLLVHLDRIELRIETGRWKAALNFARHLTPELSKLGLRNDLLSMWATLQDGLLTRQITISEIRDFYRRRWNTRTGLTALL